MLSGGVGPGRTGGRAARRKQRDGRVRPEDRDGVHHIHHADRSGWSDRRLAVGLQVADQGQARQRPMAARAPAFDPGHNAERRRRCGRHRRPVRVRPGQGDRGLGGGPRRKDLKSQRGDES